MHENSIQPNLLQLVGDCLVAGVDCLGALGGEGVVEFEAEEEPVFERGMEFVAAGGETGGEREDSGADGDAAGVGAVFALFVVGGGQSGGDGAGEGGGKLTRVPKLPSIALASHVRLRRGGASDPSTTVSCVFDFAEPRFMISHSI